MLSGRGQSPPFKGEEADLTADEPRRGRWRLVAGMTIVGALLSLAALPTLMPRDTLRPRVHVCVVSNGDSKGVRRIVDSAMVRERIKPNHAALEIRFPAAAAVARGA